MEKFAFLQELQENLPTAERKVLKRLLAVEKEKDNLEYIYRSIFRLLEKGKLDISS